MTLQFTAFFPHQVFEALQGYYLQEYASANLFKSWFGISAHAVLHK